MKFVGITKRWFLSVASVVILILISVSVALLLSIRSYYYSVADMALDSYSAERISSSFKLYGDAATDYVRAAALEERKNAIEERLLEIYEELGV